MEIGINYLESTKHQFLYYKNIGEKAIDQLEENQLFLNFNENSNSIATIIKHLSGNMISRWTNFFTTDGEKDWRNRDAEFEHEITTKEELLKIWNSGWDCFLESLNSIQPNQLSTTIFIRNEPHSVIEAINRQLAHYPYHIGQIIFYAKMLKNSEWESLSIPKKKVE
jgi:hypothetical protein